MATPPFEPSSEQRGPPELETLTGAECRQLLASGSVGRLGVIRGGFPLIIPVNYALHGDRIVIRTSAGPTFAAARQHRVSFEVDKIDARKRTGWSVLVQGFAVELVPGENGRYGEIAGVSVEPWGSGDGDRLLLVSPISVTGRRLALRRATGRTRSGP